MQLRGMPGRTTQVLNDGLPLLGAAPDAFGLLQVPPLRITSYNVCYTKLLRLVLRRPGEQPDSL